MQKLDSFHDQVIPAKDVHLAVRTTFKKVNSVRALTADATATAGALKFSTQKDGGENLVEFTVPQLSISTIVVIE